MTAGQQNFGNKYFVGKLITFRAKFTFTDPISNTVVPVDPSTVLAEVKTPDGVIRQLSGVYRMSAGVWAVPFTPAQNGVHIYRIAGTGAVVAANEGWFIAETEFPST